MSSIDLSKHFGGVRAVDGVSLRVEKGEIFGLIGPNGSGKSTIVNLISGFFPPPPAASSSTAGTSPDSRATRSSPCGIARTFQNIRLFGHLAVWQNLWVAENRDRQRRSPARGAALVGGFRGDRERIGKLLEFSGLAHKRDELAANLVLRRAAPP